MKKFLLIALISPFISMAQNFQPLDGSVSKRFFDANSVQNSDYFFHATSENISGDDIIWSQYHAVQYVPEFEPNDCIFWGDYSGAILDSTWLGNEIVYNQGTKTMTLTNKYSEPLVFNFGLSLNDSAMFYQNDTSSWYIRLVDEVIENFFGQTEIVKHFAIASFDTNGEPVENLLTGYHVILAENIGLASFIGCYHFPEVLSAMQLQGQTNPLLGEYQLSYADMYPWQPGDVIQYYTPTSYGIEYTNHTYRTLNITDREENGDTVTIHYNVYTQQIINYWPDNSSYPIPLSNPIVFNKNDVISEAPYNRALFEGYMSTYTEYPDAEYCSQSGNLNYQESFNTYCDSCFCYGPVDGFGNSIETRRYARNRGQIYLGKVWYGSIEDQNAVYVTQIYSNVGGVECGNLYLGLDEKTTFTLQVYPNPSRGSFSFSTPQLADIMWLTDISGKSVYQGRIFQQPTTFVNLERLQSGTYFLFVQLRDGTIGRAKVVILS